MSEYVFSVETGQTGECSHCPFYEPSGVVRGYGGPIKSQCRMIMEDVSFNCQKYNLHTLKIARATWRDKAVKLRKVRKKPTKK